MATIFEEYKNQSNWRNWESYVECLPIEHHDTILDLGCSIGIVTNLLAQKAKKVIGLDINADFVEEATRNCDLNNVEFIKADLRNLEEQKLPMVEGIWTSFTVAYFPEFNAVLDNWLCLLKPNGWIAIVEMNDLFAHSPLSNTTRQIFKKYYERQRAKNIYDFEMGSKVKGILENKGLKVVLEENKQDKELTFNGPAENQIVTAWENRLDRMVALQEFIGKSNFVYVKHEFLEGLKSNTHSCSTEVKFIIVRK